MKQLTILFILLYSLVINAQEPDTKNKNELKNEIGINTFSNTTTHRYSNPLVNYYLNGITYRRAYSKFDLRLGFDYYYKKYDDDYTTGRTEGNRAGKDNAGELRIGIQKSFFNSIIRPVLFADLSCYYGTSKGTDSAVGGDIIWWPRTYDYDWRIKRIGIAPGIGVNIKPLKHFSLTLETNINIAYYHDKDLEGSYYTSSGVKLFLQPIRQLSVNFHF